MMPLFATAGLRSLAVPVSARDCGPRFAAVLALALARSSRFTVLPLFATAGLRSLALARSSRFTVLPLFATAGLRSLALARSSRFTVIDSGSSAFTAGAALVAVPAATQQPGQREQLVQGGAARGVRVRRWRAVGTQVAQH